MADLSAKDVGIQFTTDLTDILNPSLGNVVAWLYDSGGGGWWRCTSEGPPAVWEQVTGGGGGGGTSIYVASGLWRTKPPAGTILLLHPVTEDITIGVGAPQCHGKCLTAPTAQADFDLQRNGVSFGTMRFAAAATTATFIVSSPVAFSQSINDDIRVISPNPQDATLATVGFSLWASRSSGDIYLAAGYWPGTMPAGTIMAFHPVAEDCTVPVGGTKSHGKALVAATAQADFDLQRNGVSFGTMRFAAAATTATFIIASPAAFAQASNDDIRVISPATPDATLADVSFAIWAAR